MSKRIKLLISKAVITVGIILLFIMLSATSVWANEYHFNDTGTSFSSSELVRYGMPLNFGDILIGECSTPGNTNAIEVTYISPSRLHRYTETVTAGSYDLRISVNEHWGYTEWIVSYLSYSPDHIGQEIQLWATGDEPVPSVGESGSYDEPDGEKKEEVREIRPVINPNALAARYWVNGKIDYKAQFGRVEQGPACKAAFSAARPAGWKEAFCFSMSYDDKHTFTMKDGILELFIPGSFQTGGREYAVMAVDKNGLVHIYRNTDKRPFVFMSKLDLEGYAFSLIYRD